MNTFIAPSMTLDREMGSCLVLVSVPLERRRALAKRSVARTISSSEGVQSGGACLSGSESAERRSSSSGENTQSGYRGKPATDDAAEDSELFAGGEEVSPVGRRVVDTLR
jgi:hypothetical protein